MASIRRVILEPVRPITSESPGALRRRSVRRCRALDRWAVWDSERERPNLRTAWLTAGRAWIALVLVFIAQRAWANDYAVKRDGSGNFTTIQACANAAMAGDTCVVYPGTYDEHVRTVAGGTSDTSRICFKAQGAATMRGFEIRHPYVTIEGFDLTGYATYWDGLITIYNGGNYCNILNNTLRDGSANVMGIYLYTSSGQAASNCIVRGNRLTNLRYMFITTGGRNHLFESNTLEYQNNTDFVRLFGSNHVFRRNVFRYAGATGAPGEHPDFSQTFGQTDTPSENHLFEENWIGDLDSQFGQFNSGGILTGHELYTNFKNVTFRRNIIVNLSMNGNFAFPGVTFEHNTFYRFAYTLSGLAFSGSLTRGDASRSLLKNNVFIESGSTPTIVNSNGFYSLEGGLFSREVIGTFITNDPLQTNPITSAIYSDLQAHGYIGSNGTILAGARALTNITQFVLDVKYATYKQTTYERLLQTVQLDSSIRNTFAADYNYVGGSASAAFPAKRSSGCSYQSTYTEWNFCETHGVNGGDPGLRSLANLLGPDGVPFTLDDGLKPLPTSRLCRAGEGGTDIGAYSCDPQKVFPGLGAPTNLRIIPQR
jgi:hypothetical protein